MQNLQLKTTSNLLLLFSHVLRIDLLNYDKDWVNCVIIQGKLALNHINISSMLTNVFS